MPHAIMIKYDSAGGNPVEGFDDFREGHNEVLASQSTNIVKRGGDDALTDKPEHYHATVRFDESEDLEQLSDELTEDVFAGVKWYGLWVHICKHTEGGGSDEKCDDWELKRHRGNIPSELL